MTERAHNEHGGEECVECPLSRRAFLRNTALAVTATLIASGLRPGTAFASALAEIRPSRVKGPLLSYALPARDEVSVDSDNDVIIARSQGMIHAFSLKCPHKGTRLQWREDEDRIYCPKHKARFDAGGQHVSGRRTRNLDRYALRLDGKAVLVDTRTVIRETDEPAAWRAAAIAAP